MFLSKGKKDSQGAKGPKIKNKPAIGKRKLIRDDQGGPRVGFKGLFGVVVGRKGSRPLETQKNGTSGNFSFLLSDP